MKTVKFDLILKVHNDLKESKLKDALENYVINNKVAENLVQKVIGEIDPPESFFIKSMELKSKRKARKNPVQSSKKNGVREKGWDVV
jgi:hypothetical protein